MKPRAPFVLISGLVLLLVGIGVFLFTNREPVITTDPETATTTPTYELGTGAISEKGEYHLIEANYPTQTPFADASLNAEAVRRMRAHEEQAIAEFKSVLDDNSELVKDFVAKGEPVPESFKNLEFRATYELTQSTRTFSYDIVTYSYTGGAHGLETSTTFTFDKQTGAYLSLADLFTPGSDYLGMLSKISRTKLPAQIGEYLQEPMLRSGTEPTADNFSTFLLTNDALIILFNPYQVGPYVLGQVRLSIPKAELSQIFKAEYR